MRRYSAPAIAFHWLTAAAILFQLGLAQRMEGPDGPDKFAVFQLHKSVGITILALTVLRLGWRLARRPPASVVQGWERRLSTAAHWTFYGLLLVLPLTGWLAVSSSRLHLPTLLYGVLPFPDLPVGEAAHGPAAASHHILATLLIALLLLHVAGALKHQLWKGDARVIPRMAGPVPWIAIALASGSIFAAGLLVRPPSPKMRAQAAPAATAMGPALPGANWTIQPGSSLAFTTAWSERPVEGRFSRWAAAVAFDPDNLAAARIRVTVDLASADTGDIQRDATLKAADWFDVAAHPTATFSADRVERTGTGYVAHGALSLKGVNLPLDLPFTLTSGPVATAVAEASLDRTAFALGQGQGSAQIPNDVRIKATIKAVRK